MLAGRRSATWIRGLIIRAGLCLILALPSAALGAEEPPLAGALAARFTLYAAPAPASLTNFTDGSGRSLGLGTFRGKVVLLNFWATWCPACIWEMASLDRLQRALGGAAGGSASRGPILGCAAAARLR